MLLIPISAFASGTVVFENVPNYGILNFTVTLISDTQVDFTWGFADNFDRIMIRGKYGQYPANIPDINTAPTDGYLVYYGTGTSTTDTSMDFDENPGALYYRAWGQKVDGTWAIVPYQSSKESAELQLLAVIGFTVFLTWLGYYLGTKSRNILLGLVGSIGWIILLVYDLNVSATSPLFGFAKGSFGDQCIIYICYIMMILIPLCVLVRIRSQDSMESKGYDITPDGGVAGSPRPTMPTRNGIMDMSNEDYRAYIRNRSNRLNHGNGRR